MNSVAAEIQPWSRLRWAVSITGVIFLQLALLMALSKGYPSRIPRLPITELILPERLPAEFLVLTDPTLLALGGPNGFSSVWMEPTKLPPVNANWDQPPRWLDIDTAQLGGVFVGYARSNASSLHGLKFKTAPQILPYEHSGTEPLANRRSTLRVAGKLAERELLSPPTLPPQKGNDLLMGSEVRVVVDSRGLVTSAIVLPPGSGSKEADRLALETAKGMRFAPISAPPETRQTLTFGRLIFDWQTVPAETTNAPTNE